MKSILDPTFVYVRSEHTDIRKTFERVRAQQADASVVSILTAEYLRIPEEFWFGPAGIGKTITICDGNKPEDNSGAKLPKWMLRRPGGVVGDDSGA